MAATDRNDAVAISTSSAARGSATHREEATQAIRLRLRLARETGRGEAEVRIAVAYALEHFRAARIREFVMVLAERDARRRLRASQIDARTTSEPEASDGRRLE
jgi:hypothetical protein